MQFGLFMMPLHPPHRSYADSYDRDIELLVQADRLGYHEAWIGEHITETWECAPVPELLIAQALGLTERIIFATGVTMLPLHHPVDTAHRIAMLDHMARGRFYWGIGVRSLRTDLDLYGVEYDTMDEVRERGKEALEVILGLWQAEDGHFGHEGKYYQVHAPEIDPKLGRRLYYKPYQKPHPPIGVAASTPDSDTIRMAGERGWIPMTNLVARHVPALWQKVEEGAASTGRKADRGQLRIGREVYVGETPESAREEARIVLGQPFQQHQWLNRKAQGNLRYVKLDPAMADEAVDVDYMMENVWIVGDPQECADKIRQEYHDVGGFGTLLAITMDPDDHSLQQRSLRLLMEEVAPRVADLS
jgi:alkanesulfonate monooxygenase SsuD/methylene tetrahydromethanopterin reductase-like flavin-dependent oxidoreductase (luciferase family)